MEESNLLGDVSNEKVFWCHNGNTIRNIYELLKEIKSLDDKGFQHHCGKEHDDFANWIGGSIGDIWLSERLRKIKDKQKYIQSIEQRITYLERKSAHREMRKIFSDKFKLALKSSTSWLKLLLMVIILALIVFTIQTQRALFEEMRYMGDRLQGMEDANSCFYTYYNSQHGQGAEAELINESFAENYCIPNTTKYLMLDDHELENTPATIGTDRIVVNQDKAVVYVPDSFMSVFADSSSMLPVLNHNSKAIEIKPASESELHVGDIISYHEGEDIIVHRIISVGNDTKGTFYITKGDNNAAADPNKIRFDDINGKIVAIIY